jgi:hypothetical protein
MRPELIDYEIKDIPQQSEIRTEEVEPMNPATLNTRNFKFKVSNTGFLDGTSMITFKLKKSATATAGDRLRVNLWNGALGSIKSATMKVGDFEIVNTQGLDRIATLRHMNKPQATRNDLLGFYLGNNLNVHVDPVKGNANDQGGDRSVGQIRPTNDSGIFFGRQDNGVGALVRNLSITTNAALNEKYGIPLYMLFPCLENRQLPLFLFQDYPVILEIEFNECSAYVNNVANYAGLYASNNTDILIDSPKLVVDYVLPPSSVINSYLSQTAAQGYRFEYPKINRVIKTLPAGSDNVVQEVEHRLGQEGREIHKIYQIKRYGSGDDPLKAALGKKILLDQSIDGGMIEEYNLEINGRDVFHDYIYNNASQYNKISMTLDEGKLYCPRSMFYTDVNSQWAAISNQTAGLRGNWKPLAIDLRNGNDSIVGGGTPVMRGSQVVFKYRRECKQDLNGVTLDSRQSMDVEYHIVRDGTAIIKKLNSGGTSVIVSA